ncbi:Uncharacterised protein [Mycobacteroides abscessus subsp. bolletii]|uniref:hypothetical protein n=1 Tax=Mycobacteroides abscessus TaxID=36809 RepID=UPI0009A7386D|nr:hypothetical protein [Mycobacteroides abscessus]SKS73285.1 Uncharacterised protein [Mycobacteroides abscessus subsp. bolletii]SKS83520.1 Uncharacterised protein [Mycobacteroides abscessus subsp. bolletii]
MSHNNIELLTFAPCGPGGRRPERIDELLGALSVYWYRNPQLRLGQIIDIFAIELAVQLKIQGDHRLAARNLEDEALLGMLKTGLPCPSAAAERYLRQVSNAVSSGEFS